ncbi:hypothetical protein [Actinomadura roseirufa]|uniref:hypothetical protein n=1 Tax=Actinomadura roseirufa TaxID=2094049 RepID=UPI001040EB86|nr:hypothetical protein [Actinomadura roseirufa]
MRRKNRKIAALRRLMSHLRVGLMYCGAYAWPTTELIAAVRAASAESAARAARRARRGAHDGRHPERVTPYADLPGDERRLLEELEQQLKRENEK